LSPDYFRSRDGLSIKEADGNMREILQGILGPTWSSTVIRIERGGHDKVQSSTTG
jgi:hypothetical protein